VWGFGAGVDWVFAGGDGFTAIGGGSGWL